MTTGDMLAYLEEIVSDGSLSGTASVVALVRNSEVPLDADGAFGEIRIVEARMDGEGEATLVADHSELRPGLSVDALRAALDGFGPGTSEYELYVRGDFQEVGDDWWTCRDAPIIATIPNAEARALGVMPRFDGFEAMFE